MLVSKSLKCYVTVLGVSWFSLVQPTSEMGVKGPKPQERGKGRREKGGEMGLDGENSSNGLREKAQLLNIIVECRIIQYNTV